MNANSSMTLSGESNALEGGTESARALANSFEVFVVDDALEGSAFAERILFDGCKPIGESNTREGGALLESSRADSFEVFVADDTFEGVAAAER